MTFAKQSILVQTLEAVSQTVCALLVLSFLGNVDSETVELKPNDERYSADSVSMITHFDPLGLILI